MSFILDISIHMAAMGKRSAPLHLLKVTILLSWYANNCRCQRSLLLQHATRLTIRILWSSSTVSPRTGVFQAGASAGSSDQQYHLNPPLLTISGPSLSTFPSRKLSWWWCISRLTRCSRPIPWAQPRQSRNESSSTTFRQKTRLRH